MVYKTFVYIHVASVIFSIGPLMLLFPMIKRLRKADLKEQSVYLQLFTLSIRIIKHAGHVLVVSGVVLVYLGSWPWTTPWLLMTLFLMFSSIFFLARGFTPNLRKLNEENPDKELLTKKLTRTTWLYLGLLMAMLWLMVTKPMFW